MFEIFGFSPHPPGICIPYSENLKISNI
jgi:hypothetical protein